MSSVRSSLELFCRARLESDARNIGRLAIGVGRTGQGELGRFTAMAIPDGRLAIISLFSNGTGEIALGVAEYHAEALILGEIERKSIQLLHLTVA